MQPSMKTVRCTLKFIYFVFLVHFVENLYYDFSDLVREKLQLNLYAIFTESENYYSGKY